MHFNLYKDKQNQWRWNFVADNDKRIADSAEGYNNRQDALHGLDLVKSNAAASRIYDHDAKKWL